MLKKLSLVAVLAGIAFAVPVAAQQAPVSTAPVQRTPIGKTEVPGSNYEVITAMVTIRRQARADFQGGAVARGTGPSHP